MKRKEWTLDYAPLVVGAAACDRKEHHEARLAYWIDRKDTAEKELREKGIEIDESAAGAGSTSNYLEPRFDSALWQQYRQCVQKVNEHRDKAKTYASWERMLNVAKDREIMLKLDVEDVEFFGL